MHKQKTPPPIYLSSSARASAPGPRRAGRRLSAARLADAACAAFAHRRGAQEDAAAHPAPLRYAKYFTVCTLNACCDTASWQSLAVCWAGGTRPLSRRLLHERSSGALCLMALSWR